MKYSVVDDLLPKQEEPTHKLAPSPLSELIDSCVGKKVVPNKHPTILNQPYRLAIVGEAPGGDEEAQGEPFVGTSGRLLNGLLSKVGIVRNACFIGNVCQYRPPANDFNRMEWNSPEVQTGISTLLNDLKTFNPNLILCLGNTALHLLKEGNVPPKRVKAKGGFVHKFPNAITDWRGSLFSSPTVGTATIPGKCLAAHHPAACLRQYEWTPLLAFDIRKAAVEAQHKNLNFPVRQLDVNLSVDEICNRLEKIRILKPTISIDIEGYVDRMSCISIATSPTESFIVPFAKMDGSNYYETPEQECRVWSALSLILADSAIGKILQNSLYDRFVLQYSYNIVVQNTTDDTMLKHWELYCELEKSLAFQASLYTREPFYKHEGKATDRDTFFRYCCRDSAVTYEINTELTKHLKRRDHYDLNMSLLNPLLYMENRGIRYDKEKASQRLEEIQTYIYGLQHELDILAGSSITDDKNNLRLAIANELCYKNDPTRPKKGCEADWKACLGYLSSNQPLTTSQIGHISIACGWSMNIKSKAFKEFLYEKLKLPKQYHETTKEISTNEEALLKLKKHLEK